MTVFKRANRPHYVYDFQADGRRYTGNTGTSDHAEALEFEAMLRASAAGQSTFARAVLKRARRALPIGGRQPKRGFVYVLLSGYFVKIGHSHDPAERIRTIATASPGDCELLFAVPGGVDLERRLHREFAASHYRREWFFLCGRLKQFIGEYQKQVASPKVPQDFPLEPVQSAASD